MNRPTKPSRESASESAAASSRRSAPTAATATSTSEPARGSAGLRAEEHGHPNGLATGEGVVQAGSDLLQTEVTPQGVSCHRDG